MKKFITTLFVLFTLVSGAFAQDFTEVISDFITKGEYVRFNYLGKKGIYYYVLRDCMNVISYSENSGQLMIKTNTNEQFTFNVQEMKYKTENSNIIFIYDFD